MVRETCVLIGLLLIIVEYNVIRLCKSPEIKANDYYSLKTIDFFQVDRTK